VDCIAASTLPEPTGVRLDMGGMRPEFPGSDPPDRSVLANALLRQVPDEDEEDEEEDERKDEDDDDEGTDDGYSE